MDAKKIHVGASGWSYDDWAGRFYPENVKGTDRLLYYCTQFDTVEVNSTFYRTPSETVIASWNKRLPRGHHFVVKGSRIVTHVRKLRNCEDSLAMFLERALRLKRLKVILWQLPPGLHRDLERLDHFLRELPETVRHAVEFRHESWWDEEVKETLARHKAAFVAVSHPELPETVFPTTDFLYLRFHGKGGQLYNYNYSRRELAQWVGKVQPFLRGRSLYAFFNNDHNAWAPKNAAMFRKLILNTLR